MNMSFEGDAWVQPDGRVHVVDVEGHSRFARERVASNTTDPVGQLESMGWLHISYYAVYQPGRHNVNESQVTALFDLLMDTIEVERLRFIRSIRRLVPDFMNEVL